MKTKIIIPVLALFVSILVISVPDAKASTPYHSGDIFAGIGSGKIAQYSSSGVLLNTLDTTTNSYEQTGMCFDSTGNLYATDFTVAKGSKFDNNGNLLKASWGGPFSTHPESCVLDNAGNIYVGEVDGANQILKFNQTGTLLASYSPNSEARGLDWIDLAADQCTMYYTSEGNFVHRFNVCTNTQLSDFSTALSGPCYANRILSNGEVLVACTNQVYRLDTTGAIAHTYPLPPGETSILFAMNINPDGKSFWTAGYETGNIYHIDVATGTILGQFNAPHTFSVAGLTVFGEQTVGCEPNCPKPVTVSTTLSSSTITLGNSFTDNATLTNATPNATGTITYNVYNTTASCTGTPLFTSTTPVTNAKATPSSPFTPTIADTYNVQAVYSGDAHNTSASSSCFSETVTVLPATGGPAITTHLSNSTIYFGRSVIDSATLTGVTPEAGGTVTYKFLFNCVCNNPPEFTSTVKVTNGIVPDSAPFTPSKTGRYAVKAIYSGDEDNKGATSKPGSEHFRVLPLTITTHLSRPSTIVGHTIRDYAYLHGVNAGAGGNVTYNIYSGNTCSGTPVFSDVKPVTNGIVPKSAYFKPAQTGTYNAQAVYSGDLNNAAATSACGTETFQVVPPNVVLSIPNSIK